VEQFEEQVSDSGEPSTLTATPSVNIDKKKKK